MAERSPGNLAHLLAELKRIELKLHEQVKQTRQATAAPADTEFRGLYISDQEVDSIVSRPLPAPTNAEADCDHESPDGHQPEDLIVRLQRLRQLFGLADFDIDVLLICLLPEIDLRYQRLYGYLQDDVTRKNPTVDLVLNLLCDSLEARLAARQVFSQEAPLVRHNLLHLYDDPGYRPAPLLSRFLQVDERIINYLLGQDRLDRRLLPIARLVRPETPSAEPVLPEDTGHRLDRLVARFSENPLIIQLLGSEGAGRKTAAEHACRQAGVPLLIADAARITATEAPAEQLLSLLFREGKLHNAALYFDHFDALLPVSETAGTGYLTFNAELAAYPHWVFLGGKQRWQPDENISRQPVFYVELPDPPHQTRRELWVRYGNHGNPLADDVNLAEIADRFRLNGGQIASAAALARSLALVRDPDDGTVTSRDIYAACRQQSGQRLSDLATKIGAAYGWEDIILPADRITELHEICDQLHHRYTVYSDWGFERKLSRGKGLNVLFAGPSGTGKTMAAEIMSNELGLDLYRIDLAGVVSKYIGETEKNLDRIFREGRTANAILFFDEADALFGKRSEVRDAHDRYANIEVAYLLQKMEEYEGMVILATNLRKNMDEAFARRMHFSIEFPQPEEADRRRIWQAVFPAEVPLAGEVDLDFMARHFRITGGNIKNIALGAAFLAAAEGVSVDMPKLIRATRREYQKMGRLCTETEFGRYFELVRN